MRAGLLMLFLMLLIGNCTDSPPVDEMTTLGRNYLDSGRTTESEEKLEQFWALHDSTWGENPHYLLKKTKILGWMGQHQRANEIFNRVPDNVLENQHDLHNRLQERFQTDNFPAALTLLRKLARVSPEMMDEWLHNSLAQFFQLRENYESQRAARIVFLEQLENPDYPVLTEASTGLRNWVHAQEVSDNPEKLLEIVRRPFGEQNARAPRYKLLLFPILAQHPALLSEAQKLLESTIQILDSQIAALKTDQTDPEQLGHRAWLRYLRAHASYLRATHTSQTEEMTHHLKLAHAFSPDNSDRQVGWGFYYDKSLLQGLDNYTLPYILHLKSIGQTDTALAVYIEYALYHPHKINELRVFHAELAGEETFDDFWQRSTRQILPLAPDFNLKTLEQTSVSLSDYAGRWLFLDFWGTWCVPCVAEIPKIQQLHKQFEAQASGNVRILAVACNNKESTVRNFRQKNNLTYPMALSDGAIEKNYKVVHFPTKILVFPNGHYLNLPRGDEGFKHLQAYLHLQDQNMDELVEKRLQ